MKTNNLLLPHSWQIGGWIAFVLWLVFAGVRLLLFYADYNVSDIPLFLRVLLMMLWELLPYLSIMLICFSRVKLLFVFVQHIRALSVFRLALFLLLLGMLSYGTERLIDYWGWPNVSYWLTWSRTYFSLTPVAAILYLLIFKGLLFYNWIKSRANG